MGSWSDWFTGKGSGLTDAQVAAQEKARRAASKKEEAAVLARTKKESTVRAQQHTLTKEEKDYQKALNTRKDLRTPEQIRLSRQGRPDTAGETMDRYLAKNFPASVYNTKSEKPGINQTNKSAKNGTKGNEKNQGTNSNKELEPKQTPVENLQNSQVGFNSERLDNTSFNINRFRSEIIDSVLPTHSYLVVFSPLKSPLNSDLMGISTPSQVRNEELTASQRVTLRCDNIILPNLGLLQEQNIRRYGYGTTENVPYGINVGDITMQFIVDNKSEVVYFFEKWFDIIVNRDSKGGADMETPNRYGYAPYEVGYKDEYSCPVINVFVYDRSNTTVMEYNIYDAFPTNLQSINLSWADENSLMKLNVTFSFTDFKINTPRSTAANEELKDLKSKDKTNLEEFLKQEDQAYEATINRNIQESLSTMPPIALGPNLSNPENTTPLDRWPAEVKPAVYIKKTPDSTIVTSA